MKGLHGVCSLVLVPCITDQKSIECVHDSRTQVSGLSTRSRRAYITAASSCGI